MDDTLLSKAGKNFIFREADETSKKYINKQTNNYNNKKKTTTTG